jgi:hypothetical protein
MCGHTSVAKAMEALKGREKLPDKDVYPFYEDEGCFEWPPSRVDWEWKPGEHKRDERD